MALATVRLLFFICAHSYFTHTTLLQGRPTGVLPDLQERIQNYRVVRGSKYARAAEEVGLTFSMAANVTRAS